MKAIEQTGFNLAYVAMQMQAAVTQPPRLRLEQVAEMKECSTTTVLGWIRTKKINAVKVFGAWKISNDEKLAACSFKKQQADKSNEDKLQEEVERLRDELNRLNKTIAELERELGLQEAQHRIENECPTCRLEHNGICEE